MSAGESQPTLGKRPCTQDLVVFRQSGCVAHTLHIPASVKRIWMPAVLVVLSLSGVAVATDALVVTPREELEGFVDAVTREATEQRLDGALDYIDLGSAPLRLTHEGSQQEYAADEVGELTEAVRSALSVFDSREQSLLQEATRLDGDRATVTTRMGDPSYEQTVIYELVRKEGRWLVRGVRVL